MLERKLNLFKLFLTSTLIQAKSTQAPLRSTSIRTDLNAGAAHIVPAAPRLAVELAYTAVIPAGQHRHQDVPAIVRPGKLADDLLQLLMRPGAVIDRGDTAINNHRGPEAEVVHELVQASGKHNVDRHQ